MNFSETFIRRPIATSLMMSAIALFGVVAYRALPVSDLPNVDFPTILVSASLPGATPETMASAVALPLEKQFSTIAGLEAMTSNSSLGGTNITLQFALGRDIDAAAQDVQAAIAQTLRTLPQGTLPPSYGKSNPADSPILFMALSSDVLPLPELDEYAQTTLAQQLSTVEGVAQVQVFGSQKYAVRIQLDPQLLASRGVGIDQHVVARERLAVDERDRDSRAVGRRRGEALHLVPRRVVAAQDFIALEQRALACEDVVVEVDDVETDDEIGAAQLFDQFVNLRFGEDPVLPVTSAERDADRHEHVRFLTPTADFRSALLRFQIEVNDVLHAANRGRANVRIVCKPGRASASRASMFTRMAGVATSPAVPP